MTDQDFYIERSILKIGNRLLNRRDADLKSFDLTSSQSETLLFFDRHDGAKILDLKDHLRITHQAARNLVERMKDKNLLSAAVSEEDARAREIHLTEKGRKVCRELKKKGSSVGSDLLRALSKEEKDLLAALLEKIGRDP